MNALRRLLGLDEPQETRVFLLMSAFGLVVGVVYWFLSYEVAGTILLIGFGVATGVIAARLAIGPDAARVRRAARGDVAPATDASGAGTGGVDTPFADEAARVPSETIAPFAVGLGVAIAATALVFGPAPLIVGILPIGWGSWSWLSSARAELAAQDEAPPQTAAAPRRYEAATPPPTTPSGGKGGRS
jgi:hypothetical protein